MRRSRISIVTPITGAETAPTLGAGVTNPSPPQVAAQTQFSTGAAHETAVRQQTGITLANQSPQALDALNRAQAILGKGVWTGSNFSMQTDLKNLLSSMGVDTAGAQNSNELIKNLARFEAIRAGGVGNTDAARNLFATGSPNTHVDPAAAMAVIRQSIGNEMAIQGYAKVVGSQTDPQAAMQAEQQFRGIPHLIQAYEFSTMKSPKDAEEFLKRYDVTKQEIASAREKLRALGAL